MDTRTLRAVIRAQWTMALQLAEAEAGPHIGLDGMVYHGPTAAAQRVVDRIKAKLAEMDMEDGVLPSPAPEPRSWQWGADAPAWLRNAK